MSVSVLQNVLFPSEQICKVEELFYHRCGAEICFDGYFNFFSCSKWERYTVVRSVFLEVEGEGDFEISLFCEKGKIAVRTVSGGRVPVRIELPEIGQQKFIWFVFRPLSPGAILKRGAYLTDQKPVRAVKLAADICTFKREEYVKNNLQILRSGILENEASPLYKKMDVFLVDNGQTLKKTETETEQIFLFPNKNAGGSGGFTRGILEILKRKKRCGYTHMIFLDDDAILMPDAFVRCYALLSFIKAEYGENSVAGALLDKDVPYLQQEAGAYYQGGRPIPARSNRDLRLSDTVKKNEDPVLVDYAGWWWACFPLSVVGPHNLPLPFFIHFDDMEYGLRDRKEIIYLNGICVWHAAPQKRRNQSIAFYHVRNRLVTDAIHDPSMSLEEVLFSCLNEILYNTLHYQYGVADMVLQAVKDFTGGPKAFGQIDPEERNKQIQNLCDLFLPLHELTDDPILQEQFRLYCEKTIDVSWMRKLVSRKKYLVTLNGWLLPATKKNVFCDIFQPDLRELYRAKRAILIDPYAVKGAWVKKSYRKLLHSLCCMLQVIFLLITKYRHASNAFKNQHFLMESKFWIKYLESVNR